MSLSAVLGWSILRCVLVTGIALPCGAQIVSVMRSGGGTHSGFARVLIGLLAVLFLMPDLLIGYAYANSMLSLVHYPAWNEVLYGALLLLKLLPIATATVLLSPAAALSNAGAHCRVLMIPPDVRGLARWKVRTATWLRGTGQDYLPAAALVFLLAFQEFEVASLMNATAWSVWLFDAHFRGQFLSESLRLVLAPAGIALLVVTPLFRLALRGGQQEVGTLRRLPAVSRVRQAGMLVVLLTGLVALVVLPVYVDGGDVGAGLRVLFRSSSQSNRLARQVGSGLAFGILSAVPAWWIVRGLLQPGGRWKVVVLCLLSVPGCVGSLVLSLTVLSLFQTGPLNFLYDTPFPLVVTLIVFLIPRCVFLHLVLSRERTTSALHELDLMRKSHDAAQQQRAGQLERALRGRPQFLMIAIPAWWSYFNLTMSAVLHPGEMETAPVALYNLMHYGRSAALTAQTFVAVLVPLALMVAGYMILCLFQRVRT